MKKEMNEAVAVGSDKQKEKNLNGEKKRWEKPTLEDVSAKIMAQPYIRFT